MKSVCIFCGSSAGVDRSFHEAAFELGRDLARFGIGIVYGGGNLGLMGAVAQGALDSGGSVIGVIPQFIVESGVETDSRVSLEIVASMHGRKALMAELSDGFLALPGGLGTLEESLEMLTWIQLGIHHKPIFLLNLNGFYDCLLGQFRVAYEAGFISESMPFQLHVARNLKEMEVLLHPFTYT